MSRWRHRLTVAAVTAPLAMLAAFLAADHGAVTLAAVVVVWASAAAVLDALLWRTGGGPLSDLLDELAARSGREARGLARDLKDRMAGCESDRARISDLLEDLSSGLGEGLLVVDAKLEIRLINRVALRFCGADRVRPESHLLEVVRDPEVLELFKVAAEGGRPRSVVVENPRGLWEVRAFPVRGGGAVGLLSDVSLTRRASEFRRRFVQDLSHELRSPLAVLRTTVEALEEEVSDELSEVLVRQVERIDRLTNELYELATIEAGQVDLEMASVPVASVVGEVIGDFRPEAERQELTFERKVPEDLQCWCDRRGLYRVLSNLVDNAVKYNRRGGWVRVEGSATSDGVAIEVADSGAGIPAGEVQAVLQRFYRIERARTPGRGGLGLGLAIVKHMVHNMGGTLSIDSREGLGTTVRLVFPDPAEDG
jgi:two-component system phosphate regulon sensor histidine kinase PhoR